MREGEVSVKLGKDVRVTRVEIVVRMVLWLWWQELARLHKWLGCQSSKGSQGT